MKLFWKFTKFTAITLVLFTALMGFAHTRSGRPVLVFLGKLAGKTELCPLGYDHASTLAEREAIRKKEAILFADKPVARDRKAIDFTLGKMNQEEFMRWIGLEHGKCRALKSSFQFECSGKFFQSGSSTLWAEFDRNQNLIGLRGIENYPDTVSAIAFFQHIKLKLEEQGLKEMTLHGSDKTQFLKSGLLAQASIESEFRNYRATIRITNMGETVAVSHNFLAY